VRAGIVRATEPASYLTSLAGFFVGEAASTTAVTVVVDCCTRWGVASKMTAERKTGVRRWRHALRWAEM